MNVNAVKKRTIFLWVMGAVILSLLGGIGTYCVLFRVEDERAQDCSFVPMGDRLIDGKRYSVYDTVESYAPPGPRGWLEDLYQTHPGVVEWLMFLTKPLARIDCAVRERRKTVYTEIPGSKAGELSPPTQPSPPLPK